VGQFGAGMILAGVGGPGTMELLCLLYGGWERSVHSL